MIFARTYEAVDRLKTAQQGQNRYCADADWCTRWSAHWRHLANTTEPFVIIIATNAEIIVILSQNRCTSSVQK